MSSGPGQPCWIDLAATDASQAQAFYAGLFGWTARPHGANGGTFVRLAHAGRDLGSLYQLQSGAMAAGVASHWTPYVRVADAGLACARAAALGGSVAVAPFVVEGVARIALLLDPGGASIGLWEDLHA